MNDADYFVKSGDRGQIDPLQATARQSHHDRVKNVSNKECSDVELLAAVIDAGRAPGQGVAVLLLQRFGSLRTLLHANNADLLACAGIGRVRLRRLRALPELARRYFEESLPCGTTIRSPADTESFLKARMQHLDHELFCCLYLDNRHRVLRFDELFRGTIDGTSLMQPKFVEKISCMPWKTNIFSLFSDSRQEYA